MGWLPDPPDPNPGLERSAQASEEIAKQQIGLAREQFDWNKAKYDELAPFIKSIYESQSRIAESSEERAAEFDKYWKEKYLPVEGKLVDSVMDYNTENRRELMAQQAAGDIGSSYGVMRGQLRRQLSRYGINPSSDRFATLNSSLMRDEALQKAGAMTKARDSAEQIGYARMLDVAGLGRGMVGAGQGAYGMAINAGNAAVNNSQVPVNQMNQGYGAAQAGYSGAAGSYGTAMRGYGMDYDARMQGYGAKMGMIGDIAGAVGTGIGLAWADGGKVSGPGGPKDDAIPAMLSDGEYVVPAAVVKKLGTRHFDKLIEKHGDDGNKQALEHRRGLKRRA